MNPDARISTALAEHPKTKKLQKRLGAAGCWGLVCLFLWTARNRPEGSLSGMSDEDIELAANWQGEDGALVLALSAVGFIDGQIGERQIHDWEEHNPWAYGARERSDAARAAAKSRWGKGKDAEGMRSACGPHAACNDPHAEGNAPSPSPSPNQEEQAPAAQPRAKKIGLDAFLAECAAIGEPPIKPDDPIYDYAASIGLPEAFLVLAWQEFKARRRSNKQAGIRGWRQHFRDAVKQNWFHLWYAKDETWELTTAGKQAQRAAA